MFISPLPASTKFPSPGALALSETRESDLCILAQPRPHHSFSATITYRDVFEIRKTTLALYLLTGPGINIPASQVPRNAQGSISHQSLDLSSVNSSLSPSAGILDSLHRGPVSRNDLKQQVLLNAPQIYLHPTHPHVHMQVSENETGQVQYSYLCPWPYLLQ